MLSQRYHRSERTFPVSFEDTATHSFQHDNGKMAPFAKRTILFVDTLFDHTGVVERIKELGLRPYVVHEVNEVSDKEKCPHIDTIVVDSLTIVRHYLLLFGVPVLSGLIWFLSPFRPTV